MNKPIKFCLILTLTLCTLLLSGCGEKDKFDKDHAEVIKLMEQAKAVQTKDLKIRDNDDLTANQDDVKAVEADIADTEKRHQDIIDQVNAKLQEMQAMPIRKRPWHHAWRISRKKSRNRISSGMTA